MSERGFDCRYDRAGGGVFHLAEQRAADGTPNAEENAPARILLVDDDVELCHSLKRLLRMDGFDANAVHDARMGAHEAIYGTYSLVVLDVMLPGGDGRLVLRKIRAVSDVPVIMLTARGDESDRIAGLEAGADDYVPKPFNVRELVARVKAVLKRRGPASVGRKAQAAAVTIIGDLEVHLMRRKVMQAGVEVALTGTEFEILRLLLGSLGKVVSRDEIAAVCLGRPVGPFDRSVDNHISNLRRKLGPMYEGSERIASLRGAGYVYTGEATP